MKLPYPFSPLALLCLLLSSTFTPSRSSARQVTSTKGAAAAALEQEVLKEINLARTRPAEYAAYLEQQRPYFKGKEYRRPGMPGLLTQEGAQALDEAISFLRAAAGGTLSVVSGSVPNFQTASCWVVVTNSGRYAYVSNTASGTVSSYRIGAGGALTLLEAVAANTGPTSAPIDMALNNGGSYLYVHAAGFQSVAAFRAEPDGSLTPIGVFSGPPFGAQGIAAR